MRINFKKFTWIDYAYLVLIPIGLISYLIDPLGVGRPESYLIESLILLGVLTIVGAYMKRKAIEIIKLLLMLIIIVLYYLPR